MKAPWAAGHAAQPVSSSYDAPQRWSRAKTMAWARVQTPSLSGRFEEMVPGRSYCCAQRKALGDVGVAQALGERRLRISRSRPVSPLEDRVLPDSSPHPVKSSIGSPQSLPGWFGLEEDVIARVQLDESPPRDRRGDETAPRPGNDLVIPGVGHQRGSPDPIQHVDQSTLPRLHQVRAQPSGEIVFRHSSIEPGHLLVRFLRG